MFLCLCTPGGTGASVSVEGFQSDSSSSTEVLSDGEDFRERTDIKTAAEQLSSCKEETKPQKEVQQVSINPVCAKDQESLQTGQLVKEVR